MVSNAVPPAIRMLTTIDLHDQMLFKTYKIKHITIERMLPTKPGARNLTLPQSLPQTSFSVGCVISQVASKHSVVERSVGLAFHGFMLPHPISTHKR